jgi:DNA-binding CsgD family transcriptional regulator
LQAVEEVLGAARAATGRLLLVEGHAGIGKTSLLDAAVVRARELGMTVLRSRGSELESDFAFGVALQLFEPLLAGADDETRDRHLAGSAALAGPLLERPTSWGGDEADERSYSVMHGLFWLLSNLADAGPVLIVIDDAHWADRPSLRLVLYLLQRIDEMAVAIIAGRRLGEPSAPEDLLGQIAAHVSCQQLRPQALSREGAHRMVSAALPGAEEVFSDACWRMTEGNAFLLGELIEAVRAEGWEPTERSAAQIGTLAPEAVLRAVAVRLMRLSDDAAGVARAVAVLGEEAQLRHVAAITDRDLDTVAAAADALAASDILRPAGTGPLAFAHPLLASAVYADVGTGERAALHRRAAEVLRNEDVAPERVAAHLLQSPGTGEGWVVDVLCAAASDALSLGAPESAASYLRRALEEPPGPERRPAVLRCLGFSEAATGLATAVERLEEALGAAVDATDRAETLLVLGRTLSATGRRDDAIAAFEEAAGIAGAGKEVAAQARAEAITLGLFDADRRAELLAASTKSGGARAANATPLLAARCIQQALRGEPQAKVLALAAQALDGTTLTDEGTDGSALYGVAATLCACDELAWGERLLTSAMSQSRSRGSVMAFANASAWRGTARWAQGRLSEALADAEQAVDAERHGWRQFLPCAYGVLIGLHLDRGELDAAEARAARYDAAPHKGSVLLAPWHEAMGRMAFAQHRERDALAHFEAWRNVVVGIENPAIFAAWRSATSRVLVALGRPDEAREFALEELVLARHFGAPRAVSVAMRALAHAEAHSDLDGPIEMLEQAVKIAAESEARLEHCRALLELGATLRRGGRRSDAGRALGEALELARACGARALEEHVLEELEVAGARVQRAALRGADALSPSERRVVALAIEGLTNRQIAEALFVTRKAVEWHLGNAYRKLDVRSRRELPEALGGAR